MECSFASRVCIVEDNSLHDVIHTSRNGLYDIISQHASTSLPLSRITRTAGLYDVVSLLDYLYTGYIRLNGRWFTTYPLQLSLLTSVENVAQLQSLLRCACVLNLMNFGPQTEK